MAYELFDDIGDFKKYVGGAVNQSMDMDSIGPHIFTAADNHLIEWLGAALYELLKEGVADEESDPGLSEALEELLPLAKRPLAFLALHEYGKIGGIQFGEAGFIRTENENAKSAFRYQENEYKAYMLQNGYNSIESMLKFLDANAVNYPAWEAKDRNRSLFINYASDFRQHYNKQLDRYTFEGLRPLIEDVEYFAIKATIGDDLYDALKAAILAGSLSSIQKPLVKLIQKAVANFTIKEGVARNWIQVKGGRVVQMEILAEQGYERQGVPIGQPVSLKIRHHEITGDRYINEIIRYLNKHQADFDGWPIPTAESDDTPEVSCPERNICAPDSPATGIVHI
jgi:hypothetical protein